MQDQKRNFLTTVATMLAMASKKGQKGFLGAMIGIMIVTLILVSAVYPVIHDAIANSSISGTDYVLLALIPTLLIIALLVSVVRLIQSD